MDRKGKFSSQKVGHSGIQLPQNTRKGVNVLYLEVAEHHCAQLFEQKINFYSPQSFPKIELLFHDFCAQLIFLKKVGKVGH